MRVCSSYDHISLNASIRHLNHVEGGVGSFTPACFLPATTVYLGNDVSVGKTNDDTVFGSVVLVLVLNNEALAGVVVGLPFPPALEFHLVALEVRPVLHHFHERL